RVGIRVRAGGAAIEDEFRTGLHAGVDVAGDLVAVGHGDERTHVRPPRAVADLQTLRPLRDLRDQLIRDRVDGDDDGDRHAAFARSAVAGVDRGVCGDVEVRVG